MTCKLPCFDAARDPERCKCRKAVLQAYKIMCLDEPQGVALEAAIRIYRYHNPQDCSDTAHLTVERWINTEKFH